VGVEPAACASFAAARAAGEPVGVATRPTVADGLAVPKVGARAFAVADPLIDKLIQVDEQSVALAVLRLMELSKSAVEGGGAAGVAALLAGQLQVHKDPCCEFLKSSDVHP